MDGGRHPRLVPTDGIGHARADLFDLEGFVGTCTASLLVDEVAAPYSEPAS